MKSLLYICLPLAALFFFTNCQAQIRNAKTETVKVYGNCGMCEKVIEQAAHKKGEAKADWDQDTKMAQITYDSTLTNPDAVLQRIAAAGYDTDQFRAPDDAYNRLPECCHYERPPQTGAVQTPAPSAPATQPTAQMVKKVVVTAPVVAPLADVYAAYFALKDALVATDAPTAIHRAQTLSTAVGQVKTEGLTAAQQAIWADAQPKLLAAAEAIRSATEVSVQRQAFATLSQNLYPVIKAVPAGAAVYYDYCPMYDEGKGGHWLSTDAPIRNPYFGAEMLTCGKVVETLK